MARSSRASRPPRPRRSAEWHQLSKQFPGRLSDADETVYSLTEPLIRAIECECPGLLARNDLEFELALRRVAGDGFSRGVKFVFPLLADYGGSALPPRRPGLPTEEDLLASEGLNATQIARALASRARFSAALHERQAGYAGWLATNAEFRDEVAQIQASLAEAIVEWGGIPRLPVEVLGRMFFSPQREYLGQHGQLMQWYGRWNIEQLATWELPLPTTSGLQDVTIYSPDAVASGGLMLFVPWYLLRDKSLTIADVGAARHVAERHPQLAEWFRRGPQSLAYDRYAQMLVLYVYLELALRRRYGERLMGWSDSLDRAFARLLLAKSGSPLTVPLNKVESRVQSVRKLRQKMQQRLGT